MSQRSFDYEKVDNLLKNAKSLKDIKGEGGVLQEMLKSTIERVMKAELEDQLHLWILTHKSSSFP